MPNRLRLLAAALVVALGHAGAAQAGCGGCSGGHHRDRLPAIDNGWPWDAPAPCCYGDYFSPYHQVYWVTPPTITAQSVIARLTALNIPLVDPPTIYLGKLPPELKKPVEEKEPPVVEKKDPPKTEEPKKEEPKKEEKKPRKDL